MKKILTKILTVLLMCAVWGTSISEVMASGNQSGQIMIAKEDVEVKESPDAGANTIVSYKSGDTVFVTGESDGWYTVVYQGENGYVPKEKLKKMALGDGAEQDMNEDTEITEDAGNTGSEEVEENPEIAENIEENEKAEPALEEQDKVLDKDISQKEEDAYQEYVDALTAEMEAVEVEGRMVVEEVERQREEKKHASFWGIIIVGLIIGIFATGIISTKKEKKKEDTEIIDLDKEN